MIDKLTTVSRSSVDTRVGRLTAEQLVEVERVARHVRFRHHPVHWISAISR
jgi:hypothetical protein